MNIADFRKPDGSGKTQGSDVGRKSPSIQLAVTALAKFFKYSEAKLRPESRPAELLLDRDMFRPGHSRPQLFLEVYEQQGGLAQIDQVESGDCVAIQGHQAKLSGRNFALQLSA